MNQIMLYHIWRLARYQKYSDGNLYLVGSKDIPEFYDDGTEDGGDNKAVDDPQMRYTLEATVTDMEYAQQACYESNGELVYTWSEAWYHSAS